MTSHPFFLVRTLRSIRKVCVCRQAIPVQQLREVHHGFVRAVLLTVISIPYQVSYLSSKKCKKYTGGISIPPANTAFLLFTVSGSALFSADSVFFTFPRIRIKTARSDNVFCQENDRLHFYRLILFHPWFPFFSVLLIIKHFHKLILQLVIILSHFS